MTVTASRRQFMTNAGLVIGVALPIGRAAALAPGAAAAKPFAPNAFVRIAADDTVTVVIKHIEFGQGPSTGLTTILADELDADWGQMRIAFAPANDALYKNTMLGTMATGGSTAIANSWDQMRNAGAAARAMLVTAAARRWRVPAAEVKVSKGVVSHGSRSARFGELADAAGRLPVPEKPVLKTPEQWTLIGTDVPKIDSVSKSNGTAVFALDVVRPNMVHAVIQHPPAFGGTVGSVDKTAALAVPGVVAVEAIPQGVVVYARDTYAAMRGRQALKVEWDLSKAETRSTEAMLATYLATAKTPGVQAEVAGSAATGLANAIKTIEATYVFPYLAHAPMETIDAVIELTGNRADVWIGSQFQVGDMTALAKTLGIPFESVTLHQQLAGGSFGRRATPKMEFAVELASVAKAYPRAPVKFAWTRENDIKGGHYRPLFVHKLKAGVDAKGEIAGWDQVVVGQSFMAGSPFESAQVKDGVDATMVEGAIHGIYELPNRRIGAHIMPNGVPSLWWRSVGSTHTAYAQDTMLDELLDLGGKDKVAGRLALMTDPRAKGVLTRVAEIAGWGSKLPEGRARGVAMHKSFGTYVAQIAEVSKGADGLPKVHKIWCAVDCGVPVNPNVIRAQMEGGIGFGLGHALYAEVTLGEGGVVEQGNFDTYRSLRMAEMPAIEVAVIASTADPTGVGEPGLPPTAPSIANAWRALTGKSVRRLPFAHGDNA